jgi:hypothetical protein
MIEYEIASPSPDPFSFVVKYGSKIRLRTSSGIPVPESCTVRHT